MVYTPEGASANCPAPVVYDAEAPCIFTGVASATISGGQFVYSSGTNGAVVLGTAGTFAATDITLAPSASADQVNGIALNNAASGTNNLVAVLRKGAVLVKAYETVSGGCPVMFSSGGVSNIFSAGAGSASIPGAGQFVSIGRALTPGADGGYALVALNL